MLFSIGFGDCWEKQEVTNTYCFLQEVKERLICISYQNIHAKISEQCPQYLTYHYDFRRAGYIDSINCISKRRFLALLRLCSLPLNNNLYKIKKSITCLCNLCATQDVQNEYHVIFVCQKFVNQRRLYLKEETIQKKSFDYLFTKETNDNIVEFVREIYFTVRLL